MSRLSLTIKNAWVVFLFYTSYLIIQFYSRDIFLEKLGDEFMGVFGTLKSILQFLNLSELGIGAAVGFSLYKPIYEKDINKINEIIGYLGFLYKRIGIFLLIASSIILAFFPQIFQSADVNLAIVIFLFVALLTSNLLNYFFTYQMFLLEADQKSYMNITINQSVYILRLFLQCLVLIYFKSIFLWILLEFITPVIYVILLRKKIKKTYPWLVFKFKTTKEIREKNSALLRKIKQLSFHKVGNFVTNGTDNIIIFSFINSSTVAFVGNYQLIMSNLNTLINQIFKGVDASVGNLVAENNLNNIIKVFWEMMAMRFFIAGCTAVMIYFSFDNLIALWVGEKYLMSEEILLALITIFFILQIRTPVDTYIQAYGLYGDTWSPIAESIINLAFSIILVLKYDLIGIFFGTIISQFVIIMIWRPYYLFNFGFKINNFNYWKGFSLHLIYLIISFIIFYKVKSLIVINNEISFSVLIYNLSKIGFIFSVIYFVILLAVSKGFQNIINRFLNYIKIKM